MSKSNFTIIKQCTFCNQLFEAQKRTTKYCSHRCNSKHYKQIKRLQTVQEVQINEQIQVVQSAASKVYDLTEIKNKEFITISEAAILLSCSKKTVYRLIQEDKIHSLKLSPRVTRIRTIDIYNLFDEKQPLSQQSDNYYTAAEIVSKYGITKSTLYGFSNKYSIKKTYKDGIKLYSQTDIDNIFNS